LVFVGKENDIILVSLTARGKQPSGFLSDARRLNVLTSRAKRLLLVFGSLTCFSGSKAWREILDCFKQAQQTELNSSLSGLGLTLPHELELLVDNDWKRVKHWTDLEKL
jgi:hypothetical protein